MVLGCEATFYRECLGLHFRFCWDVRCYGRGSRAVGLHADRGMSEAVVLIGGRGGGGCFCVHVSSAFDLLRVIQYQHAFELFAQRPDDLEHLLRL
eukprot:1175829-Prorocentrum_minimum.AAC.2